MTPPREIELDFNLVSGQQRSISAVFLRRDGDEFIYGDLAGISFKDMFNEQRYLSEKYSLFGKTDAPFPAGPATVGTPSLALYGARAVEADASQPSLVASTTQWGLDQASVSVGVECDSLALPAVAASPVGELGSAHGPYRGNRTSFASDG